VVSTEGPLGDLVVRIDGADVGPITPGVHPAVDVPFGTYRVRTGSVHHVVVIDSEGRELSYELDPASARHGWVLAPHARERELCLASVTWYYGPHLSEDQDSILNDDGAGDLVALQRRFDHFFSPPPTTIKTKGVNGKRSSLRALACEAFDRNEIVPFKAREPSSGTRPATPM